MLASVRMALRQVCRSTFLLDDALKRLGHGLGLVPIHDADHCVLRVDIDDAQDVPVLSRLLARVPQVFLIGYLPKGVK